MTINLDEATAARVGKMTGIHYFVFGKVLSILVTPAQEASEGSGTESGYYWRNGVRVPTSVQWHKRYREASSEIVISYQVIDVEKGTVVKSDTITQRQVDRTQWVTYVGDEGMIPREVLAYVTTGDRPVATGEVLTSRATQAAAGMISSRIRQYFQ